MFKKLFKKKKSLSFYAYAEGEAISIEKVPDPVFSQKMMGDGIAIIPTKGQIFAPCSGEIVMIAATNHAIGIKTDEGIEILLHLGLDTALLEGNEIDVLCNMHDQVETHQVIAKISDKLLNDSTINTISMLIFTNIQEYEIAECFTGRIQRNQELLQVVQKEDL